MYAQDKTNRRLGRLTVLSAIFMPITFLAGIWGMNFKNMPTISLEYGFVIAILTMAAISWAMYLYFRKKGWFD
jgi:magnesium transporter